MGSNRKATRSRGDLMKRMDDAEAAIAHLQTARRLPNSSYADGGPRTRGGRFLAEDLGGEKVFEVTTEPPDIFMRPELIATVARQVIGESVFFQAVPSAAIRTAFDTFGDLETLIGSNASPGPEVSFDLSGDKFLAIWGAPTNTTINSTTETRSEGYMSVEVSGAASDPAAVDRSNQQDITFPAVSGNLGLVTSPVVAQMFTDLGPGSYTVTAKYRLDDQGSSQLTDVTWRDRWLLVIAF